jgi:hypothetical protein
MNQSRCCAKERGSSPERGAGSTGGTPAPEAGSSAWIRAASPATVCASKIARSGTSTRKAARTREITRAATSECPPSAKKLSSIPTRSTPSTSPQMAASTSSAGVRGAAYAPAPSVPTSGAGRARRSTLPLGVSGSASNATKTAGTM